MTNAYVDRSDYNPSITIFASVTVFIAIYFITDLFNVENKKHKKNYFIIISTLLIYSLMNQYLTIYSNIDLFSATLVSGAFAFVIQLFDLLTKKCNTVTKNFENKDTDIVKVLYSPVQVGIGSLLGGPLASIYFIKNNFNNLEKNESAITTVVIGSIIMILFPFYFFIVKLQTNISFIPIAIIAMLLVHKCQIKAFDLQHSNTYKTQPYVKLIGISLLLLVITFFLGIFIIIYIPNIISTLKHLLAIFI